MLIKKNCFDNAIIEIFYILVHFNIFPFVTNFLDFLLVHLIALMILLRTFSKSTIISSVLILLIWQSRSSANPDNLIIIITVFGLQNLHHLVFWYTGIVIIPHFVIFLDVSIFSSSSISICDLLLLQKWLLVFSFFTFWCVWSVSNCIYATSSNYWLN